MARRLALGSILDIKVHQSVIQQASSRDQPDRARMLLKLLPVCRELLGVPTESGDQIPAEPAPETFLIAGLVVLYLRRQELPIVGAG